MIPLTPLESEILGEMAWDSHLVGEIMGFVRSSMPYPSDYSVFRETYELLDKWIERGWLDLGKQPHDCEGISTIQDVLPYLERHGPSLTSPESDVPLPEVDLTDKAFLDVEWLRGAV